MSRYQVGVLPFAVAPLDPVPLPPAPLLEPAAAAVGASVVPLQASSDDDAVSNVSR